MVLGATRLLRITAPHFVAGAVFEKQAGAWRLTRCAPILRRHLAGKSIEEIRHYVNQQVAAGRWVKEWVKST